MLPHTPTQRKIEQRKAQQVQQKEGNRFLNNFIILAKNKRTEMAKAEKICAYSKRQSTQTMSCNLDESLTTLLAVCKVPRTSAIQ